MPTPIPFRWTSASTSIAGKVREANEDACLDMPASGLWVVADGMGGHNAGDVASRMIIEALAGVRPHPRPSALVDDVEDRLQAVNAALYSRSIDAQGGGLSGSTVVALLAFDRYVVSLWAGDSRIYRCQGTTLEQITRDHSEVQEFAAGRATGAGPASNVITRAVGGTEHLYLDMELRELRDGDHFLLCSDGLTKELSDDQIAQHLARSDPRAACKALIEHALSGPCVDNVTVLAVQFREAS
jgi:serine/threonine protein phosphatase PrpC